MERRIGNYLVEKALGAGSFATVWLAHDELLEDQVAIKVLAENWSRHDDVRRRFIEEAKILRRIDHDRVIRVHVIDTTPDGQPYFVMSWADRGSMHDRLVAMSGSKVHATGKAINLIVEVLEALAIVHDFGVVHRDIKPSNVLFRSVASHERNAAQRAGRVLGEEMAILGDFGLAKDLAGASGFTQAAGTPAYMAPEQSRTSSTIDHRADLYSMAALLYELLAGQPPFAADTLSDVRRGRNDHHATSLRQLRPDLSDALVSLVDTGLSIDPDHRPATAEAMIDALRTIHVDSGAQTIITEPVPTGAPGRVLDLFERARGIVGNDPTLRDLLDKADDELSRPIIVGTEDGTEYGSTDLLGPHGADVMIADDYVPADPEPLGGGPVVVLPPAQIPRSEIERLRQLLVDEREMAIQASRGLLALRRALDHVTPEMMPDTRELLHQIDELERDLPGLTELAVLRDLSAGRIKLPRPLVADFRRLLLEVEPARRVGIDPDSDHDAVQAAVVTTLDSWRGRLNEGRIPFAARPAVERLIASLELLWSNVVERS